MEARARDWAAVMDRLIEGDRLALVEVSRLLASFLRRWNAYDFRDEWDDLIQEVIVATASALAEGRIRERAAVIGYLKSTARFKLANRLKRHLGHREDDHLPWDELVGHELETTEEFEPPNRDLAQALERLDPLKRRAVLSVYAEGMTYDEAAAECEIPLGTLKGHLRDGLRQLRAVLSRRTSRKSNPIPGAAKTPYAGRSKRSRGSGS